MNFEQVIQERKTYKNNNQRANQSKKTCDTCFSQKLQHQLCTIATQYFSHTNFPCTVDCLYCCKVDEIYASNDEQEQTNQTQCKNEVFTKSATIKIAQAFIIMNFFQWLKCQIIIWIYRFNMLINKTSQQFIKLFPRIITRQLYKTIILVR